MQNAVQQTNGPLEVIAHIEQNPDMFQHVLSVCTVIIAIVAIFFTILSFLIQRDHNRKSLRPILELRISEITNQNWAIELFNYGLGPALIDTYKIVKKDNSKSWEELFDGKISINQRNNLLKYNQLHKNARIGVDKSFILLKVDISDCPNQVAFSMLVENMKIILADCFFQVVYRDLYDKIGANGVLNFPITTNERTGLL